MAFSDDPIYVNVDQERTVLAFVNLLNNAIRFSPEGSRIVIGAVEQGKEIMAWVQDSGEGIPVNKLQKVFEEFYQLEPPNTRRHGGLGIGLTIAKGIIEMQGGRIWVESEGTGKGTTVKVTLPKV
jgi:signal transduction histidine kinase